MRTTILAFGILLSGCPSDPPGYNNPRDGAPIDAPEGQTCDRPPHVDDDVWTCGKDASVSVDAAVTPDAGETCEDTHPHQTGAGHTSHGQGNGYGHCKDKTK